MGMSFSHLVLFAKTQGEHTFTVSEASNSGRVMTLSGASRTYSHTAEPRFVEKANKTSELPPVSVADAGKLVGVTDEGKFGLVEGGGGNLPITPIIATPGDDVNIVLDKTFNEIIELINAENTIPLLFWPDDNSIYVFNHYIDEGDDHQIFFALLTARLSPNLNNDGLIYPYSEVVVEPDHCTVVYKTFDIAATLE